MALSMVSNMGESTTREAGISRSQDVTHSRRRGLDEAPATEISFPYHTARSTLAVSFAVADEKLENLVGVVRKQLLCSVVEILFLIAE